MGDLMGIPKQDSLLAMNSAAAELLTPTGFAPAPFKSQLLKWVGNKQRFAPEIISYFPRQFGAYYEPFLGSGGVLGTLAPRVGYAGDAFTPLVEIWATLKRDPKQVVQWYAERRALVDRLGKVEAYQQVLASYNKSANGADLLFLSRAAYGGVMRFRKSDGYMSTPCGAHMPMPTNSFAKRATEWHGRISNTDFHNCDYRELMSRAMKGDVIYCDPPYVDSQAILYGAQAFKLSDLYSSIEKCTARGVFIALSIDGMKKSGKNLIDVAPPPGLFKREVMVHCGGSMLKRFQRAGGDVIDDGVSDRLLLNY
jgi:DNA adenine methylase